MQRTASNHARHRRRHSPEWLVGGASALLVAALVAYLGYQAFFGEDRPPQFTVTVADTMRQADGLHVTIRVLNQGDQTAAQVLVGGFAEEGTGVADLPPLQFDYVPAGSTRRGTFILSNGQSVDSYRFVVTGYSKP